MNQKREGRADDAEERKNGHAEAERKFPPKKKGQEKKRNSKPVKHPMEYNRKATHHMSTNLTTKKAQKRERKRLEMSREKKNHEEKPECKPQIFFLSLSLNLAAFGRFQLTGGAVPERFRGEFLSH